MSDILDKLVKIIRSRKGSDSDVKSSYTSFLFSKGKDYCLKKLKEEVGELEEAIKNYKLFELKKSKIIIHETADVIYHLLVTLESVGVNFDDIIKELKKREGTSGFEEKKNR
jgi:phosphoribosyl-ATP pyrophosphohydrolase